MKELIELWNETDGTTKIKEIIEALKDIESKMKLLNFGLELKKQKLKIPCDSCGRRVICNHVGTQWLCRRCRRNN